MASWTPASESGAVRRDPVSTFVSETVSPRGSSPRSTLATTVIAAPRHNSSVTEASSTSSVSVTTGMATKGFSSGGTRARSAIEPNEKV